MSEQMFMDRLKIALGRHEEMRIHRQNVGSVEMKRGGWFHAGPPNGASDISGIVRPEGWRIEIECKSPRGRQSKAQKAWARMIESYGGVHVLVRGDGSPESVARAVADIEAAIAKRRGSSACSRREHA